MPSSPSPLSTSDAARVVTLLGEVSGLDGPLREKRQILLDGICDLVEADAWVWGLFVQLTPGSFPSYILHQHNGFDPGQITRYLEALEHPGTARFTAPFAQILQEKRCHITRFRQQYTDEQDYLGSDVQKAWQLAGIEPGILSCRPLDATTLSTVAVYRRPGAAPFDERASRLVHILLSEVPWLHESHSATESAAPIPTLSPRSCTVLNFLVHGHPRRDIATHLGISPHTVDDYVKDVFRHFGVHSQPELIARFLHGDLGDLP